ncbi:hypothetical protein WJX81_001061 [Elliptochloris bilobata]|uniref:Uncharacterized protein n=1 Tax=Elliptochloris bilobata TaxID=381761 RepID=A0AAW1RFS7_9CHLO
MLHLMQPSQAGANGSQQGCNLFDVLVENDSAEERQALAFQTAVLVPRHARFLLSDVTRMRPLLPSSVDTAYHCIVVDPPWENKSVGRGAKYPTLPSHRLLGLPIPRLMHPEGVLALWVTNRERLRRFVEEKLLPAWGLVPVAQWFWVKVTARGVLVTPLEVAHRRPYEVILLARKTPSGSTRSHGASQLSVEPAPVAGQPAAAAVSPAPAAENPARAAGDPAPAIPHNLVLVACPEEHSRKPPLGRLLAPLLPPQPRCLELFARNLVAGWTTWGNDALRFQTLDRFKTARA